MGMPRDQIRELLGKGETKSSDEQYLRHGVEFEYSDNAKLVEGMWFFGVKWDSYGSVFKPFKGQPADGVNWGASPEQLIAKLGQPDSKEAVNSYKALYYGPYKFTFHDNKLDILATRNSEAFAKYWSSPSKKVAKPVTLEDEMVADFNALDDRVGNIVNVTNNTIAEYDSMKFYYQNGQFLSDKKSKEDKVRRLQGECNELIDDFEKKYSGKMTSEVKNGVTELRRRVNAGGIKYNN